MVAHGRRGEAEHAADVVVGQALGQELEHLELARRQTGDAGTVVEGDAIGGGGGRALRGHRALGAGGRVA